MKKYGIILAVGLLCAVLSGCCLSHEWQEATCEAPKTCAKCGETEGEAMGHTWEAATCATPKNCIACGVTEGETLTHNWAEANYQQPKMCANCGESEGEPLPPAFETMNVKGQWIEEDKVYEYITTCYEDKTKKTVGKILINYKPQVSDDNLEAKEGYEWRSVDVRISFSDDNAWKDGFLVRGSLDNYYDIIGFDNNVLFNENEDECSFAVNWNGKEYDECYMRETSETTGWVYRTNIFTFHHDYMIPIGYDGVVIGFYDGSIEKDEGQYIFDIADENTLFFRLT